MIAVHVSLCVLYLLQCMLWPNAVTLLVPAAMVAVRIVLAMRDKDVYRPTVAMFAYAAIFFVLYTTQHMRDVPYVTSWIHPNHRQNYSFTETGNNEFSGGVNGEANVYLREHPFTWPRLHKAPGVRINGTLPRAGPGGTALRCGGGVDCYAANMAEMDGRAVPMPSNFYAVDVMVTPPAGMACKHVEIYRIVYNSWLVVDHSLDYPASSPPLAASSNAKCNVFGKGDGWCLSFMHTFTAAEYNATVAEKCKAEGGVVIFRLPPRTVDVDPETGRVALDAILVTAGAGVSFRYTWRNKDAGQLLDNWVQWEYTKTDAIQEWRDSTEMFPVILRYMIASLPLMMLWYFLLVGYDRTAESSIVQPMCIFILTPASIVFFSVGAWIPLAGTVLCGIAINLQSNDAVRMGLYAVALLCNVIHLLYMTISYAVFGYNAFMRADSIQTVGTAFVSGSPAWITLTMPTTFCVNLFFCIGIAVCLWFSVRHKK
jgi:hypothetical protein